MKNETFFEFMHKCATDWKEKSSDQKLTERYEVFLSVLESFRENARNFDDAQKLMLDAVIDFARNALKALLFINAGGVFIVMMAMSAVVSKESKYAYLLSPLAQESSYFIGGIVFSVVSMASAYLAQRIYAYGSNDKAGDIVNFISVFVGACSLAAFIAGAVALRAVFLIKPCQ